MDFGRVTAEEIATINFTLPPDAPGNLEVLPGQPADTKFYTGLPKWGRTEWAGPLYPTKTKEKDFLKYYVTHFNAVELNATHYKIYGSAGIAKWADVARDRNFKFCPKMYKGVTHFRALQGKEFLVNEFVRGVEAFGEHLGPVFIQLSDHFSNKRSNELFSFLEKLPDRFPFFVELRHRDIVANPAIYDFLQAKGLGSVITDAGGRRDALHMHLTIPKTFIRFVGTGQPVDRERLTAWAERIKVWKEQGLEEVYFFIHPFDERYGLELMQFAIDRFNEICEAKLSPLLLNP